MGKLRRFWPVLIIALVGGAVSWWWLYTSRPGYRLRQGQEALKRNDLDAAEQQALRLEAAGAVDAARLLSGQILMSQARSLDPASPQARALWAQALALFNRIEDQGEIRRQAIALCGQCHLQLGQVIEAERVFTYLLNQHPDDLDGQRGMAALAFDLGAFSAAIHHCREWARLDPSDGRPHRFMGMIWKDLSKIGDAIPCYQDALARHLTETVKEEVRLELAECYFRQKDYQQALSTLQPCAPPDELLPKLLALEAECFLAQGKADQALTRVERARKIYPDFPDGLRIQAKLHLQAGETRAAADLLEKAVQLKPANYVCRHLLAQAYMGLNRPADAKKQLGLAEEIKDNLDSLSKLAHEVMEHPKDPTLHLRMADLYQKLDMPEMAVRNRRLAEILSAKNR